MILQTKEIIAWMCTENLRKFVAKCVHCVWNNKLFQRKWIHR